MDNAVKVAALLGPVFLLLGLSILIYVKSWQKLFEKWWKDHFSLFPVMLMQFVFGILIIRMYNVWEWNVWLIVTISGWGMMLKGLFYFLAPGPAVQAAMELRKSTNLFYFAGAVCLILGGILSYYVYLV